MTYSFFSNLLQYKFDLIRSIKHHHMGFNQNCIQIDPNVGLRKYFLPWSINKIALKLEKCLVFPTFGPDFIIWMSSKVVFMIQLWSSHVFSINLTKEILKMWKVHFGGFETKINQNGYSAVVVCFWSFESKIIQL